jgi:hypothetical protein
MRTVAGLSALFLILGLAAALAQATNLPPDSSMKMEIHGSAVTGSSAIQNSLSSGLDEFLSDIPTNQISKFANSTPLDVTSAVVARRVGRFIAPSHQQWCWSLPKMVSGLGPWSIPLETS